MKQGHQFDPKIKHDVVQKWAIHLVVNAEQHFKCAILALSLSRQRSSPRIERFSPIPFSGRPSTLSVPARAIGEHAVERALFVLTI